MDEQLPIDADSFEDSTSLLFVKSAELQGIKERTRGKKTQYVFVINLEWSDGSSSTIWRSYSEFFELQCKLLDSFAEEAGRGKRKLRIIPFLPGREIFKKSDLKLAEERRPKMEKYIQDLLLLPSNISKSHLVTAFYHHARDDPESFNQFPVQLNMYSDFESLDKEHVTINNSHGNSFTGSYMNPSYVSSLSRENQYSVK